MNEQKYDIQRAFEDAGLFLDEIEWDDMERLRYSSQPPEDWAHDYIRRHRPYGLTPEIAKHEILHRKREKDNLLSELRIKHHKACFSAFVAASVIAANDCLTSRPIDSVGEALLAYCMVLLGGFLGLLCAAIISGVWEVLVARSNNKMLSGKLGTILSYAVVPLMAAALCFLMSGNSTDQAADQTANSVDQAAYTDLQEENSTLSANLEDTENAYNQALDKIDALSDKAQFLDDTVRFVAENGTKYHRYDCHYIKEAPSIYYMFIDDIANYDYTPCSECNP